VDLALAVVGAALVAGGWWVEQGQRRRTQDDRRQAYRDCVELLTEPTFAPETTAYPVLRGRYRGSPIRMELIVDTLAVRKLPVLWLKIDVRLPLPVAGVFDFLVRPQNTEFWSPLWRLPHDLAIPSDWPAHALLRTDNHDTAILQSTIAEFMAEFNDERMKELVISPHGVRLVYMADQGRRLHYGVLRRAHFEQLPLPNAMVGNLLNMITALHRRCAESEKVTS
jgi:hypothetical protein